MWRILVINPGSTSTKIAVFDDGAELFKVNISHPVEQIHKYSRVIEQFDFRKEVILEELARAGIPRESIQVRDRSIFDGCEENYFFPAIETTSQGGDLNLRPNAKRPGESPMGASCTKPDFAVSFARG